MRRELFTCEMIPIPFCRRLERVNPTGRDAALVHERYRLLNHTYFVSLRVVMISIRLRRDLYLETTWLSPTTTYYASIPTTKPVTCQKRQAAAAINMLLHGRLALCHAPCKRHATFVISSSCKFNCFSHAAAFAMLHAAVTSCQPE